MRGMIRQGDVMLVPVTSIPESAQPVPLEGGRTILAHGEATGHHHSYGGGSGVQLLEAPDGERYLSVEREAALEHQEHSTIQTAPGAYRVVLQREFDDAEEWRRVAD